MIGWRLKTIGVLRLIAGLIGFTDTFMKVGPALVEALQHPEQRISGLIIVLALLWLLLFPLLGFVGAILVGGIGFVFSDWGTEPVITASIQLPTASTPARRAEPG